MQGIQGKVAIVTGAGRGIGQAVALGLAEDGALIVANDLDQEPLDETLGQIRAMGGQGVGLAASVGDADIGEKANIGAGTITVNYDGFTKSRTIVGKGARVGSNTMLVAPVEIGEGAFTGAGSVITEDVADGALALERSQQKEIPGYAARKAERHERKKAD